MLCSVLAATALWGSVALVFWAQLVIWVASALGEWLAQATFFVSWNTSGVASVAAKVLILLTLVPLIQLTALLILGIFGMPAMVKHVTSRCFQGLKRRHGGSLAGSVWNSIISVVGLVLLAVASLPFWIFPPLWPIIPPAIMGWVNQRLLRYDALAEHADACEMRELFGQCRSTLYLLGVVLALLAYVPMVGFFAPTMFGLAFIHYLLSELEALRRTAVVADVLHR